MSRLVTVDDIISQVRSLLDESSGSTISDTIDIIPSLNRGQAYAFNILARKYPEPILTNSTLTLTNGTAEYDMPENIFEDRIEKIETFNNKYYYPCKRISYRDATAYETAATSPTPAYWTTYSRKIRFIPAPTGTYQARLWYIMEPDNLVKSQGRITTISVAGGYVVVEGLGSDLTTTDNDLDNYVNIFDGQTGEYRCSLQINNITGSKITFRTSATRSTVLNRTISTAIPTTVAADDYVCVVSGSCVPYFMYPISNFMIEFAAIEMRGVKLSEDIQVLDKLTDKFEQQIERSWVKRETDLRISKRSRPFQGARGRVRVRTY